MINRRKFIQGLATVGGTSLALTCTEQQALAAADNFFKSRRTDAYRARLFSIEQLTTLHKICSYLIPATDTPGAAETECHLFVDHYLTGCIEEQTQLKTKKLLHELDERATTRYGHPFIHLAPEQSVALLESLDTGIAPFNPDLQQDFRNLKFLVCLGYYTSFTGATRELAYQAIPGGFKGSVPLDQTGKAWGSLPRI
ncbi:gluconate 2-dehydrogenase subunit 3 family protein [Microbulbifer sp. SSSA005]|uniref:gluconate 2-dehydrogenase subunit 3 family protein n=1 Tax=unclassified Microbulbifer TaxID=2619833 RepID=UPI00403AA217